MHAQRRIAGCLVVAAAAGAAVLAGCGGKSYPLVPPSQIAKAAYASTHGSGFKYAISVSASSDSEDVTIDGHGAIDSHADRGNLTMEADGKTIELLIDQPYVYVHTGDGPWLRAKADEQSASSGSGAGGASSEATSDPSRLLAMLSASGHVQNRGAEDVNGVPTTHYSAQLDLDRLLAPDKTGGDAKRARQVAAAFKKLVRSSTMPVDLFIDDQHRVRRMAFHLDLCTSEGDATLDFKFDFLQYGPQTVPGLPHGAEVRDATDQLKRKQPDTQDLADAGC